MSNGTDRFFEEMLDSATRIAKKDAAAEVRKLRNELKAERKAKVEAIKEIATVAKREAAVLQREVAINKSCTKSEVALAKRETQIKLAEKEICHLMNQIDKIKKDTAIETTTVTTRKISGDITRSGTGYGWNYYPTPQARALSTLRSRIRKQEQVEKEA